MPYTLPQLEFLGLHMGISFPPEVLEKKRLEHKDEPTSSETGEKTSLVTLQQGRLAWDKARNQIQAELQNLQKSIVAACQADPEIGGDSVDVGIIQTILDRLDNKLLAKLDDALNEADAGKRFQLNQEAKAIAEGFLAYVNGSALMADIDENGFESTTIRKTAVEALTFLTTKI